MRALTAALVVCACGPSTTTQSPGTGAAPGVEVSIFRLRDFRLPVLPGESQMQNMYLARTVIVDRRFVDLGEGGQELRLSVAVGILPGTVWATSLSRLGSIEVVEHKVIRGSLTPGEIMASLIGKSVDIATSGGPVRGVLFAFDSERLALTEGDGRIRTIPLDSVTSISAPGDIQTGTSLITKARVTQPGKYLVERGYVTSDFSWQADYEIELDRADVGGAMAEMSATATVRNSGFKLEDAVVSLYSGLLGSKQRSARRVWTGPLSLERYETVQVPLVRPIKRIPARIRYIYRGAVLDMMRKDTDAMFGMQGQSTVRRMLEIRNSKDHGLGTTLPAGKVNVSLPTDVSQHSDDIVVATMSAILRPVGPGEMIRIDLGAHGSEVRGQRRQTAVSRSGDGKRIVESYEVIISNDSDKIADVAVVEPLPRSGEPKLLESKPTAQRVRRELWFDLEVPAHGEKTVRYKVEYRW